MTETPCNHPTSLWMRGKQGKNASIAYMASAEQYTAGDGDAASGVTSGFHQEKNDGVGGSVVGESGQVFLLA